MMKMFLSDAKELIEVFVELAECAMGHEPENLTELHDVMDYAVSTFGKTMHDLEQSTGEKWEFLLDEEDDDDCTCPYCYDDEDNLWTEDEEEEDEEGYCGCRSNCDCDCVNHSKEEEETEITNPNYIEIDKELTEFFKAMGMEEPSEEDLEHAHQFAESIVEGITSFFKERSES